MMQKLLKILLLSLLLAYPFLAQAANLEQQRSQFLAARAALQKGDYQEFLRLSQALRDYSLYPYLRYAQLRSKIVAVDATQIEDFVDAYAGSPLAEQLRSEWLLQLGKEQQWLVFLEHYQPTNNSDLFCYYRRALLATGKQQEPALDYTSLWLSGYDENPACAPLFSNWVKSGGLTKELIWKRIKLLMAKPMIDKEILINLAQLLPKNEQAIVNLWSRVQKEPNLITRSNVFNKYFPKSQALLVYGVERLAKHNPEQASKVWLNLSRRYAFSKAYQQEVYQTLAVALATENNPLAAFWFKKIDSAYTDKKVREWRIRFALMQSDWEAVQKGIELLPMAEQSSSCWRYWRARALEKQGEMVSAQQQYHILAKENSYYGFLASWRLGESWQSHKLTLPISEHDLAAIELLPGIKRAQELYQLKFIADARAEWQYAIKPLNRMQLYAAAKLAQRWNWYDRAIVTAAKANVQDDLNLRFPLAYQNFVLVEAKEQNIDPAWIFAVMRQESAFIPDAKSSVGALGLMQLMPKTAQSVANQLKMRVDKVSDLFNISLNIRFGANYLKTLNEWYHGNIILATAAYNAGPTNIQKWLTDEHAIPTDVWVDTIPWRETRDYVKSVLSYMAIYEQHLGRQSILQQQLNAML